MPFIVGVLLVFLDRTTTCSWSGGSGRRHAADDAKGISDCRVMVIGSMIADAVRYMSVHSRKHPDLQGRSGTTTVCSTTARNPAYAQATGHFRREWQVLGSNQRRLSRRFYREPIPTHRNSR